MEAINEYVDKIDKMAHGAKSEKSPTYMNLCKYTAQAKV